MGNCCVAAKLVMLGCCLLGAGKILRGVLRVGVLRGFASFSMATLPGGGAARVTTNFLSRVSGLWCDLKYSVIFPCCILMLFTRGVDVTRSFGGRFKGGLLSSAQCQGGWWAED